MTGLVELYPAIFAALPDVDGWRHVETPPASTGLPAMWLELVGGGGGVGNPLGVPATVRVVAVPRPQPSPALYAALAPLIDALDVLRTVPIAGGAVTGYAWRIGRVALGGVDHDAVFYDLTFTYLPNC